MKVFDAEMLVSWSDVVDSYIDGDANEFVVIYDSGLPPAHYPLGDE